MKEQKRYFDVLEIKNSSFIQFIHDIPITKIFGKTVSLFNKLSSDLENILFYYECLLYKYSGMSMFLSLIESFTTSVIPIGFANSLYSLLMLVANIEPINEGTKRIDRTLNEDIIKHPVGPSGSSKSTIDSLILRFRNIEQGKICNGEINIKNILIL
ncbi:hypothetical protein U3516DRAFT_791855 [Neocallimastix sp. 'constans']